MLKKLADLPAATRSQLLALAGVTPEILAGYIVEVLAVSGAALRATRVQRLVVPGAKGEGATVEEFIDIDHTVRLQGADMLSKVIGLYAPRATQQADPAAPGQVVNVNVSFADMSPTARLVPPAQAQPVQGEVIEVQAARQLIGTRVAQEGGA